MGWIAIPLRFGCTASFYRGFVTSFSINIKWPQMYVTGNTVTLEQAKEIIRRTDSFITEGYGGNDREWNKKVRDLLGLNDKYGFDFDSYPDSGEEIPAIEERRRRHEEFQKKWQPVKTHYVHNNWMSSAYIGGPHGWCHPNGMIGYSHNIGKWPSAEEVIDDWKMIAEAFPFLDVGVTIMDAEGTIFPLEPGEEYPKPNFSILVKQGEAQAVDPKEVDVHAQHVNYAERLRLPAKVAQDLIFGGLEREHGLPWSWIEEWAEWSRKIEEMPKQETFLLGDEVTWTSQSSGYVRTKVGTVVEVVPPNTLPKSKIRGHGLQRDHESYVVRAKVIYTDDRKRGSKLYWPKVALLKKGR